jgi:hypothetical protein
MCLVSGDRGVRSRFGLFIPPAASKRRVPFSGHLQCPTNLALKPWAVLSDHFMVKIRRRA